MSHSVTVNSGHGHTVIDGVEHQAGETVTVSTATFNALTTAGRFTDGTLTDNGVVGGSTEDGVEIQATFVAAPAALTSSAPAALTSTAPSAGYVQAEATALRADVAALRTNQAAIQADLAALRTTQAALLAALKGADKPMAAS
jgi:hypothetical protein